MIIEDYNSHKLKQGLQKYITGEVVLYDSTKDLFASVSDMFLKIVNIYTKIFTAKKHESPIIQRIEILKEYELINNIEGWTEDFDELQQSLHVFYKGFYMVYSFIANRLYELKNSTELNVYVNNEPIRNIKVVYGKEGLQEVMDKNKDLYRLITNINNIHIFFKKHYPLGIQNYLKLFEVFGIYVGDYKKSKLALPSNKGDKLIKLKAKDYRPVNPKGRFELNYDYLEKILDNIQKNKGWLNLQYKKEFDSIFSYFKMQCESDFILPYDITPLGMK